MASFPASRRLLGPSRSILHAAQRPRQCLARHRIQPPLRRGILTTGLLDAAGLASMAPANMLVGLHSFGTPWLVAIPLTAWLIRRCIVYPLFQEPQRISTARYGAVRPHADAMWAHEIGDRKWRERTSFQSPVQRIKTQMRIASDLRKRFKAGISRGFWAKAIPFLILLTITEAMRRLCGWDRGLLSIILDPIMSFLAHPMRFFKSLDEEPPAVVGPVYAGLMEKCWNTPMRDGFVRMFGEDMAARMATPVHAARVRLQDEEDVRVAAQNELIARAQDEAAMARQDEAGAPAEEQKQTPMYQNYTTVGWFQESLKTAGPSWCKDLTTRDESKLLPTLFVSAMIFSIWYNPGQSKPAAAPAASFASDDRTARSSLAPELLEQPLPAAALKRQRRWKRILTVLSGVCFIPAMQMPAALLVYYIANTAVLKLHTLRLVKRYPILQAPLRSKIPPRSRQTLTYKMIREIDYPGASQLRIPEKLKP